ncbi:MAG: tRNA (guanosine(37)-N1)-methyltransferase TrmD, partial [Planctomycetaceae bacterium]
TRPREFRGMAVPDVLVGGDHAKITAWRQEQAELRTMQRRPDLWEKYRRTQENDSRDFSE